MFPHFFVSFFSRFQSFCESKEREKRRKGRRESSFFLVSGLPLPSPPLFHKKYKKFCQHKTSSVCALKSRTWHTIRRNARRLFSFPRHSSFVLYVFVLMFLCARICCSFLLLFFYSSRLFSSSKQKGSKKPKNLFVSFFWKERKKERVEREKERRKKRREREREREREERTRFFFSFFLFQSLSLSFSHSFARTNSRRRTSRNTSPTHPKLCRSTYDAHESARAKYHRSWWSRAVPTTRRNDAKPETTLATLGVQFSNFLV